MVKIAIGLGTNLGDRKANLIHASEVLSEDCLYGAQFSNIYETKPWGIIEQPDFLNAVAVGYTEWKPPAILNFLKVLEKEMGRKETVKNGPRLIDLDLLIFGNEIWQEPGLNVPHLGLSVRDFVLMPLNELWPDWMHPKLNKTVLEMNSTIIEKTQTKPTVTGPLQLNIKTP